VTGFSLGEIDTILDDASEKKPVEPGSEDHVPAVVAAPVSRKGDLWILGSHRLLCGDARSDKDYARLLEGQAADLVLTDPPFNVRVDGNVSGLGKVRHEEFATASENAGVEGVQRIVLATPRPESVGKPKEVFLVDCFENRRDRLLDNFILQTQNAQGSFRAISNAQVRTGVAPGQNPADPLWPPRGQAT